MAFRIGHKSSFIRIDDQLREVRGWQREVLSKILFQKWLFFAIFLEYVFVKGVILPKGQLVVGWRLMKKGYAHSYTGNKGDMENLHGSDGRNLILEKKNKGR